MLEYESTYVFECGKAKAPTLLDRIRATIVLAIMIVLGAAVLAGILAVGLVLLPFVLVGGLIAWFLVRRRIRQALRAMEEPSSNQSGRVNVKVRQ